MRCDFIALHANRFTIETFNCIIILSTIAIISSITELLFQVTCKECMWSPLHRGHASESAAGAGKRVASYLSAVLQRAKTLLNMLLTQYNRNAFANSVSEEMRDTFISMDYRYVSSMIQ